MRGASDQNSGMYLLARLGSNKGPWWEEKTLLKKTMTAMLECRRRYSCLAVVQTERCLMVLKFLSVSAWSRFQKRE